MNCDLPRSGEHSSSNMFRGVATIFGPPAIFYPGTKNKEIENQYFSKRRKCEKLSTGPFFIRLPVPQPRGITIPLNMLDLNIVQCRIEFTEMRMEHSIHIIQNILDI